MDLTIRDLMVIAGVLLILAVALDAARRIHSERYSRARPKPGFVADEEEEETSSQEDDQLFWPRELPNGPARVVSRGDASRAAADAHGTGGRASAAGEPGGRTESPSASRPATEFNGAARRVSRSTARNAGKPESRSQEGADEVELVTGMSAVEDAGQTPRSRSTGSRKAAGSSRTGAGSGGKKGRVAGKAGKSRKEATSGDVDKTAEAAAPAPAPEEDQAPQNLDWLDDLAGEETRARRAGGDRGGDAGKLPRGVEPEVFMLNVVSRSPEGFSGDDILHILLACDLRFGDMDFFHRHENEAGRGAIQFSVANMMQPGVFNLDTMADFNTPGLVFFVTLPGPEDMMKAFDYMLETARVVARNLDGDVLDESRSVVTRQTLDHSRQKIRDLERRMLARASHQ